MLWFTETKIAYLRIHELSSRASATRHDTETLHIYLHFHIIATLFAYFLACHPYIFLNFYCFYLLYTYKGSPNRGFPYSHDIGAMKGTDCVWSTAACTAMNLYKPLTVYTTVGNSLNLPVKLTASKYIHTATSGELYAATHAVSQISDLLIQRLGALVILCIVVTEASLAGLFLLVPGIKW